MADGYAVRLLALVIRMLNRSWRIAATGFCFAVFGLGGLCLWVIWFPLLRLIMSDKRELQCTAQRTIQLAFLAFLQLMKAVRVMDFRIEGGERLRTERGCLVVANHPSLIDYVLIASQMPQCDCLVKAALWRNPFVHGVVRAAGYIPNNDGSVELLDHCRQRLQDGNNLLIFPEGTRSVPGQPLKLQRGAAQIAVRSGHDLLLVHIHCTPPVLTKQQPWYRVPASKPVFHVRIGSRVSITDFVDGAVPESLAARRLTAALRTALTPEPVFCSK